MGGGANGVLLPYIGESERFYSEEEGGQRSLMFYILNSLFWVLDSCKNRVTFVNANWNSGARKWYR